MSNINKYLHHDEPYLFLFLKIPILFILKLKHFSKICSLMGCLPSLLPLDIILDVVEVEVEGEVACEVSPKEDVGPVSIVPGTYQFSEQPTNLTKIWKT